MHLIFNAKNPTKVKLIESLNEVPANGNYVVIDLERLPVTMFRNGDAVPATSINELNNWDELSGNI